MALPHHALPSASITDQSDERDAAPPVGLPSVQSCSQLATQAPIHIKTITKVMYIYCTYINLYHTLMFLTNHIALFEVVYFIYYISQLTYYTSER